MDVSFSNAKLAKVCNAFAKLRAEYGDRMAKVIATRLSDLKAAQTLEQMKKLPGRCHALTANWSGHFAVDLVHPDRLVFKPIDSPLPLREDGGLDWGKVTKIEVVGIGDYH